MEDILGNSRQINTDFWIDPYSEKLSPSEKLLFLYLITCPAGNIAGCFSIGIKNIACDTGMSVDVVTKAMDRLVADGKCYYKDNVFAFKNGLKYASLSSPKIRAGIETIMSKVSEEVREFVLYQYHMDRVSIGYQYGIDTSNKNKNSNKNSSSTVLSTNGKEEKKKDPRVKVLTDYFFNAHLNKRGKKVAIIPGKDGDIFKTLLETFTEDEIKERIDKFMVFKDDWMSDKPYNVGMFKSQFDKVMVGEKKIGIHTETYKPKYTGFAKEEIKK